LLSERNESACVQEQDRPFTGPATAPDAGSLADVDAAARLEEADRTIRELRAALRAAAARERKLANELQHRVRNILGVIRSIYRRSRANGASQDEFAEHFEGRLNAITRYEVNIAEIGPAGVELEDVIRDELLQVHSGPEHRLTIAGPVVRLRGKWLELIGLAVHELATNSIKFGALLHRGKLNVQWALRTSPDGQLLDLRWTELGVPAVALAPRPSGFGREVIEQALPYELGATTMFEITPGGMACSIVLPLPPHDASASNNSINDDALLPSEWSDDDDQS
jgi:two-component system CheB/CheR fusion protein